MFMAHPRLSRARQNFITARVAITNPLKAVAKHKTLKNQASTAIPRGHPASLDFCILFIQVWEAYENISAILYD